MSNFDSKFILLIFIELPSKLYKKDLIRFIHNFQKIRTCKLLLVHDKNFLGLKKTTGDFTLNNSKVTRWKKNEQNLYYSGLQIINPNIFNLIKEQSFSLNKLWDILIANQKLKGSIIESKVVHIGDINAFNKINTS